ncbi:MAG: sigma-70 family RNA polymerase sigma factor [Planctomycetales bacterium]|nr:sigma-70 family RNA polymerase sigma factor [Planctomycetales bacterium]
MLRVRDFDDTLAFDELLRGYQARLLRLIKNMVVDASVAEDLVQDVFLRVWRARKNYQPTAKFSTWVFHIAHNVASNSVRDRNRRKEFPVSGKLSSDTGTFAMEHIAMASTGAMPTRKIDRSEREEMVRLALQALNERQRTALILSRYEELSYQEIADTMELTIQAVKSLLCRARVNLGILLKPYMEGGQSPLSSNSGSDESDQNSGLTDRLETPGGHDEL